MAKIDTIQKEIDISVRLFVLSFKGGAGSGYFGHAGRPGKRGGSSPNNFAGAGRDGYRIINSMSESSEKYGSLGRGAWITKSNQVVDTEGQEHCDTILRNIDQPKTKRLFGEIKKEDGYIFGYKVNEQAIANGALRVRENGFRNSIQIQGLNIDTKTLRRIQNLFLDGKLVAIDSNSTIVWDDRTRQYIEASYGDFMAADKVVKRTSYTGYNGITLKGGPGSGYFGHAGRPGKRGGSAPSSTSSSGQRANSAWYVFAVDGQGLAELSPKRLKAQVAEALNAIDSVHSIPPNMTEIGIKSFSSDTTGARIFRLASSGMVLKIEVSKNIVNQDQEERAFDFVHEFGHYLDYEDGYRKKTGKGGIFNEDDKKKVLEAIKSTKSFEQLKELSNGVVTEVVTTDLNKKFISKKNTTPGWEYVHYAMQNDELFARGYAQYIAQKSRNPSLIKTAAKYAKVGAVRGEKYTTMFWGTQWTKKDFEKVSKAFDKMFSNAGLTWD